MFPIGDGRGWVGGSGTKEVIIFLKTKFLEFRSMKTKIMIQKIRFYLLLHYQVYLKMGFTQEELDAHFAGPAFFAW